MTDQRMTPDPSKITNDTAGQISIPLTDLCRSPGGPRDRQALYGDALVILGADSGWNYVQLTKDSYCGYIKSSDIGAQLQATHHVISAATHAYETPDFKSPDRASLSFGSRIHVSSITQGFAETTLGHIPVQHLSPIAKSASDPSEIARIFLGTPYLWGGNSRWGIDCSGLIQAACLACGIPCPGDSDQQQKMLGAPVPVGSSYEKNDLLFWKGHVALVVETDLLIHANAHHMAVTLEPISEAIPRIAKSDGPISAHKRLSLPNGLQSKPGFG